MKILTGRPGRTLLECIRDDARDGEAIHAAPCGGRGRCGKCRVRILSEAPDAPGEGTCLEPPSESELAFLTPDDLTSGIRLSCLAAFRVPGSVKADVTDEKIVALTAGGVPAIDPADRADFDPKRPLVLAVDLGTTTIACMLLDAEATSALASGSVANGQRRWGADVVSRIEAAADPEALALMSRTVVSQIEGLFESLLARADRLKDEAGALYVSGNTTMLHLLMRCDPSGLGRLPFSPVFLGRRTLRAGDAGFTAFPDCSLVLLPGISAFVGADLTAGILAEGLHDLPEPELLIDIGTNGEIVLASPSGIVGTATAAGPAFEGAHVVCGSPGVPGAIDHTGWDDGGLWYTTIRDAPAGGICGSGLLDLLAALRQRGIVDETGFLDAPDGPDGTPRFSVTPDGSIYLTQSDIRQLQLAKGAVAAGVRVLCLREGIQLSSIRKVHLAGGFGTFMNPVSALAAGLLPVELSGKISASGNTALRGTVRTALSKSGLDSCTRFASNARVVDLASDPSFQDEFMNSMLFPDDETVAALYGVKGGAE